jgi:hypothetical protein
MPYGVGAGGDAGIAFEDILEPVQSALATATTGGTITAGTYIYAVTAINALGETLISNERTIVTTGATSTVTVTWAAVTGATGYKLYKTAAGGATQTELLYKTVGLVVTDIDTAPGAPAGAIPTTNSALTPGVYQAPTKFVPFLSETVKYVQETVWRRPIRQTADITGASPGNVHVEGDLELEVLEDVLPYFLFCGRTTCVKTGSSPNFVYTFTPTSAAVPPRTFSLTIERTAGVVFGYTGCVVSSLKFGVNNGLLTVTVSIIGRDEASAATPTPVWPTSNVFGAGQYSIEIPTATPVFDTDVFEFVVDDQAVPDFRLKNTGRGAQLVHYGERNCTTHFERDFVDRVDYDAFKAYTSQALTITASKGINNLVTLNVQQAIKDTYEVNLSGQGDLVRAQINYQNTPNLGATQAYSIIVKTQENIS